MSQPPQLLVEWSSPWREFLDSIGPALRPSPPRLRGEAKAGLFPARGMFLAFVLEVAALATVIAHPMNLPEPEAAQASPQEHDVIYFTADELPRTDDLAGGAAGHHGAHGGASLQHPTQTIKVARGEKLDARVVDAPDLQLPQSESQVSNLLAYKATIPTAPAQPIVVRADHAPQVMVATNAMPKLPTASVTPIAPPPTIKVPHERAKTEPHAAIQAPVMPITPDHMPKLPAANLTAKAPPAPIQVARSRRMTERSTSAGTPNVSIAKEQMPDLPEASVEAKAPPAPIRVTQPRRGTASKASAAPAPRINGLQTGSSESRLTNVVSETSPSLPNGPPRPVVLNNSNTAGVIVSPNPGSKAAVPKDQEKTTVAMDRGGATTLGSGGTGGGTGMKPGKGTGSSATGTDAGAPAVGTGKGADLYARNGNSPNLGPGGTGNMPNGTPRAPGVSVSGGQNSITLPSFGGPPSPSSGGHSETKNMGTGITVIASPRAGGALNLYGALKGDRVYTIYINTRLGTAIMQFADPTSVEHTFSAALTSPTVMRADIAGENTVGGHVPRVLISCVLDRQGIVRNAHVLQSESSDFAARMLAALPSWKFTPAFRGNQPVAVDAIIGFGVDTE